MTNALEDDVVMPEGIPQDGGTMGMGTGILLDGRAESQAASNKKESTKYDQRSTYEFG